MRKPKVYICGPIKGYDYLERCELFRRVAEIIMDLGYVAVNPIENGLSKESPEEMHMKRDIQLLLGCDFMYQLDGHEKSANCNTEEAVARSCGISILNDKQLRHISNLMKSAL